MLRYFACSQYKSKDRPVVVVSDMSLGEDKILEKVETYFYQNIADMMPGSVKEISYYEYIDNPECFIHNYL